MIKAHYLLLQRVRDNAPKPRYDGLQRAIPPWVLRDEHSLTEQIWMDQCNASEEEEDSWAFLPSLEVAKQFFDRYKEHGTEFDIVAVYECTSPADVQVVERLSGYIGLDVSSTEPDSALHPARIWAS